MEIPSICVCTAPDAATAQTSLLIVVIAGATAVGGGDFTVVSEVLLEVESVVTDVWAIAGDKYMTKSTNNANFLFILLPLLGYISNNFWHMPTIFSALIDLLDNK